MQPFITPDALYVLVVPANTYTENAFHRLAGQWLDFLLAGAPGAVVQVVLSHCDKMLRGQEVRAAPHSSCPLRRSSAAPDPRFQPV